MVFQCINVCQVPREWLKTSAFGLGFQHLPRDLANVNTWKTMFDPYIAKLYQETEFGPLEDRRNKQKLITFYKMSNSLSPIYLSRLVSPQVRENSEYLLRNTSNTSTIHTNSNLYYNSFLPSVIRHWNNLALLVRNSTSLSDFKKNLRGQEGKPPVYFYFGNRAAQIYHQALAIHLLIGGGSRFSGGESRKHIAV